MRERKKQKPKTTVSVWICASTDFCPGNPSHGIDALCVAPLEVPRTQMDSLQMLVERHRNTGIQKQRCKSGRAPRETIGKTKSENGVGQGKKGLKDSTRNPRQFPEQNPHRFFCSEICSNQGRKIINSSNSCQTVSNATKNNIWAPVRRMPGRRITTFKYQSGLEVGKHVPAPQLFSFTGPRNPRTTPQNRRSTSWVRNWGWCVFCLFLGSNNLHTTPPKKTTWWRRSSVGMVRGWRSPISTF